MVFLKKIFYSLLLVFTTACTKNSGQVTRINPQEAYGALQNNFAVLLDVREEDELKEEGTAQPAKWFATSKISKDNPEWKKFLSEIPKDKQIVVYCAAGVRAQKIASLLVEEGYKAANMGGFQDWVKAGLPTRKF